MIGSPFQGLRLAFQDLLREAGSASDFLLMKTRPGHLPWDPQDRGGGLWSGQFRRRGGFTPVFLS